MYRDYTVGSPVADRAAPDGPIENRWERRRFGVKLVNPANKRARHIIVVGTGLAGASAGASLGELGYQVGSFCYQDSPRRAHSIAAQGGINAAKDCRNDGDSVYRLCYDTVKGGDFRARESTVYRLAEISGQIIDQCVAQGVPFAREYGGLLEPRSFGGVQVSRTFYARGQTGQQLLIDIASRAGARRRCCTGRAGLRLRAPEHPELPTRLTLRIWRQGSAEQKGRLVSYQVDDVTEDMSFLEMIDVLNEKLILRGVEPVAFDHDCREGICGACGMVIDGVPHGPEKASTTRQLYLRSFADGETVTVEPFRAAGFPVLRDLVVDRSAFDRIIQAGGYVAAATSCIDCGACVCRLPERFRLAVPRRQDHSPRPAGAGPTGALPAGPAGARGARGERLRRMYQHRSAHHRLSEGDTTGCDRTVEPRLPCRHAAWPGRALNTGRQAPGGRRAGPAEGACPAAAERTFDLRHTWSPVRVTPVSTWAVDAA